MDGDDVRDRVRRAIAAPVTEAEKLLAELQGAPVETTMAIMVSGWGRGLAAGLEELASAIDALGRRDAQPPASAPPQPQPTQDEPRPPSEDAQRRDLAGAGEERLAEEARRSREETAEAARAADEARRELES